MSLIAGGFSIELLVLLLLVSPPGNSAQQLSYVASHGALVKVFEFSVILWATLPAPFAFALGTLLRGQSRVVAGPASALSVVGILLLGFATYTNTGALIAIQPPARHRPQADTCIWRPSGASSDTC